ncbi:MAG: hypothetical protein IJJ15_00635 [Ruminococcus sp.]|nr:hypothetical protein [Ruminococcus sp.]
MKLKKSSSFKEKIRSLKPFRATIICLLLAVILVSGSIGLSYGRYLLTNNISENINFLDLNFIHSENYVVGYIDRENTDEPIVLNYKDEVIVTVPRGLSAENTCVAYAMIVDDYTGPVLTETGNYAIDVDVRLVGLTYPTNQNIAEGNVSTRNISFGAKRAELKVITDTGISDYDFSVDMTNSWMLGYNSPYLVLSDINNLGTYNSPCQITFTYSKGSKGTWQDAIADDSEATDWYTEDPNSSSYDIVSAVQLAGLAKLVNEGVSSFDEVTINLSEDISLYGSGGVDDRIEWVPIGTEDNPFKGSLDGYGYRISGITVGSSANDYAGLFGVIEGDPDDSDNYYIKNMLIDSAVIYGGSGSYTGTVAGKATAYTVSDITASELIISGASDAKIGLVVGQANESFSYGNCQMNTLDSDDYDDIGEDNTQNPIEVMEADVCYNVNTGKVTLSVTIYNDSDNTINVFYDWFSIKQNGNSYGPENTSGYQEVGNGRYEITFELTDDAQNIDYNETVALYMNDELINDDITVTIQN